MFNKDFKKFVKETTGKDLKELLKLPSDEFDKELDKLIEKLGKGSDEKLFIEFKELENGSIETTMNGTLVDVLMAISIGTGRYLSYHKENIKNMKGLVERMVKIIMEEIK